MPITQALAPRVLEVPALLEQLDGMEGDEKAAVRKPIVQRVKATIGAVAANAGKSGDYEINLVTSPQGEKLVVIAPSHFTDAQVFEQAEDERYKLNTWAKLGDYCIEQLQAQARGELYPQHLREWMLTILAGLLSLPFAALVLGLFVGWVWRGFRANARTA